MFPEFVLTYRRSARTFIGALIYLQPGDLSLRIKVISTGTRIQTKITQLFISPRISET